MRRIEKPAGKYKIVTTEVDRPEPTTTEVLIRAERSLISRGSELWRRYSLEEPVDPDAMGYAMCGTVVETGALVDDFEPGDRVASLSPHAEYVTAETGSDPKAEPEVVQVPDTVDAETATLWPFVTSCSLWSWSCNIQPSDTVVVQGQGVVGTTYLQVVAADTEAKLLALDPLPLRCDIAAQLGADAVINVDDRDPVTVVAEHTGGGGADIVVEAVGGPAGPEAFEEALEMAANGGLVQVLGLYEDEPLPLDSGTLQGKRVIGGAVCPPPRPEASAHAINLLGEGSIEIEPMITHRFNPDDAQAAFDLLYEHPEDSLGVIFVWDD